MGLLLPAPKKGEEAGLGLTPCGGGSLAGAEPQHEAGPGWHWQGRCRSLQRAASSLSERGPDDSGPSSCTRQRLAIRAA